MLAALLFVGLAAAADPDRGDLHLVAQGLRNQSGEVLFMLFDSPGAWLEIDRAVRVARVAPTDAEARITFANLPPGEYAVGVIHDENRNGRMDMRWLPYPQPGEGVGASNNAPAKLGPPAYDDARFQLTLPALTLPVTITYVK